MSGSMEKSHFWAITLDAAKKEQTWECLSNSTDGDNEHTVVVQHSLIVRLAVIGPDTNQDETQVIEVETNGYNNKKLKSQIFAAKGTSTLTTELVMSDNPVTFRLVSGSGPVHISGTHLVETAFNDADDEDGLMGLDDEDEDDDEEEEEPIAEPPKKKKK